MGASLFGREREIEALGQRLDGALGGAGSTTIVSGEAGVGKSRLVAEFSKLAEAKGFAVLTGVAASERNQPFQVFSRALDAAAGKPLFTEVEYARFDRVFAMGEGGEVAASAEASGAQDASSTKFGEVLAAVQGFVRDSFAGSSEAAGLGRLEFGETKAIIERAGGTFIIGVITGAEHPDMGASLKRAAQAVAAQGRDPSASIEARLRELAGARFLVKRRFEGAKLDNERARIADKALSTIGEMSRSRPVALVLEDIHWADESSLFVLRYLCRNVGGHRIIILVTMRADEKSQLQGSIAKMKEEGGAAEMAIGRLDTRGVRQVIDSIYSPNKFQEGFYEKVAGECRGNPFFIIELMRQMKDSGSIASIDGKWAVVNEEFAIPSTIEEVVQGRLGALDADTMMMAEYASCIGREFDSGVARSLGSLADPSGALSKLNDCGVLAIDGDRCEFTHAFFRDVLYSNISERWRRGHHKSLGEHYERSHEGRLHDVAYELALHFSRSASHSKAAEYCALAGEKAASAYSPEQAARYFSDALSALGHLGGAGWTATKRMELLDRLGDMKDLYGDKGGALKDYRAILEGATPDGTQASALRKIGNILTLMDRYDDALAELAKGKEHALRGGKLEYGRIISAMGFISWRKGQHDRSIELQNEALAAIEGEPHAERDRGAIYGQIGNSYWFKGDFKSALGYHMKALEISERMRDLRGTCSSYNNIGITYIRLGDYDQALVWLSKALEITKGLGDLWIFGSTSGNMGNIYAAKGDNARALECYESALRVFERIGDKQSTASGLNNIGSLLMEMGRYDEAEERTLRSYGIREAIGDKRGMRTCLLTLGSIAYGKGEWAKSLELHEKALRLAEAEGDKVVLLYASAGVANAQARTGDIEAARTNAIKARDMATAMGVKELLFEIQLTLGEIEGVSGNWDESDSMFQAGIAGLVSSGRASNVPKYRMEYAAMLRKKGDAARARAEIESAVEEYKRMGARERAEKARKEMESL
ncbi:MAG: tetratricopeptide repeat protein [Euryarchaeota archaeon]|nr:tetratricopeptide repeat protein [Euryarchaeota archaeon]